MGNCLTSTKVAAQIDQAEYDEPRHGSRQQEPIKEAAAMEGAAEVADEVLKIINKKKKVVRFKLNEESNVERNNGVVRMRIVVTQKELRQILNSGKGQNKCSSTAEVLRVMRSRGGGDCASDEGFHGAWTPALETIPEEH